MLKAENIQTLLNTIASQQYEPPIVTSTSKAHKSGENKTQSITSICLIDLHSGNLLAQSTSNSGGKEGNDSADEIPLSTLKLMCLLMKDKFYSDPKQHTPILSIPSSAQDESAASDATMMQTQTYELDIEAKYNVCVARLPRDSSLLLCVLAKSDFEKGLLKIVLQGSVDHFKELWGYSFD